MIHHVSLGTNDVLLSRIFYGAVLPILGLRLLKVSDEAADYRVSTVLFSLETPVDGKPASAGIGVHIGFDAGGRAAVDEFHATALSTVGSTRENPECAPNTIRIATARSSWIRIETRSRR